MKNKTGGIFYALLAFFTLVCNRSPESGKESSPPAVSIDLDSVAKSISSRQHLDTFEWLLDENYEKVRKLLHSRPFWIKDADTVGLEHPCDGDSPAYFKVTPFLVLSWMAVSPNAGRGWVAYEVDWIPPGRDYYMPDGEVKITWSPLPTDSQGVTAAYTPGEGFKISKEAQWDTSFAATFKERSARVFSQRVPYVYGGVKWHMQYETNVFFERKGVVFRIEAICEAKPQFLGPKSEWWRWVARHWYWLDEPHPDWSRYPIHPDSIKYKRAEDDIPPEERSSEDP